MFIIVFKATGRDPHLAMTDHYFLERFETYEDAVTEAENCRDEESYYDYEIFEEC